MSLAHFSLIAVAIVAANLPFFSPRIAFVIKPASRQKKFIWRALEWLAFYFFCGGLAYLLESRVGPIHPQHWQFYAATLLLFTVLAYPGFIFCYLLKSH